MKTSVSHVYIDLLIIISTCCDKESKSSISSKIIFFTNTSLLNGLLIISKYEGNFLVPE